jgi:hypothetical protein
MDTAESLFLFIDIQEKLVRMLNKDTIRKKALIMARSAGILGISCVLTEQYPAGLGSTVEEIKNALPDGTKIFEKTHFNAMAENSIKSSVSGKKNIFVMGIETHICVLQTVETLIGEGFNVFVVKDACASREKDEFEAGIKYMRDAGAKIVTSEIVLFEFLESSEHPYFKQVQSLIKNK